MIHYPTGQNRMTQQADLNWWRTAADRWITPIEDAKAALRGNRERLDHEYPNWKAKLEAAPGQWWTHDARREWFVTVRVILQNAQLSLIFMRDQLSDTTWHTQMVGEFRPMAAVQVLREYSLMIKFYTVHATAATTEETLRAIIRADPSTFTTRPLKGLGPVYEHFLAVTQLTGFAPLFKIVRLTRNTIHTNGVFSPPDAQNVQVSYGNRQFVFEVGKGLDWLGLNEAMIQIVTAPVVAEIPDCPRAA